MISWPIGLQLQKRRQFILEKNSGQQKEGGNSMPKQAIKTKCDEIKTINKNDKDKRLHAESQRQRKREDA